MNSFFLLVSISLTFSLWPTLAAEPSRPFMVNIPSYVDIDENGNAERIEANGKKKKVLSTEGKDEDVSVATWNTTYKTKDDTPYFTNIEQLRIRKDSNGAGKVRELYYHRHIRKFNKSSEAGNPNYDYSPEHVYSEFNKSGKVVASTKCTMEREDEGSKCLTISIGLCGEAKDLMRKNFLAKNYAEVRSEMEKCNKVYKGLSDEIKSNMETTKKHFDRMNALRPNSIRPLSIDEKSQVNVMKTVADEYKKISDILDACSKYEKELGVEDPETNRNSTPGNTTKGT